MNIDCHAHFIPPGTLDAAKASPDINVTVADGTVRFRFPELDWSPPAPAGITDKGRFVAWHREAGLDVQILSCWTDLLGYTLPAAVADRWCTGVNEAMAAEVADCPSLDAMGIVPLQDPARCSAHLERIAALGLKGVVIGTSAPGVMLDDLALTPFWAVAQESGLPILIHPIFLHSDSALAGPGLANAVGRGNATNVAITRLLFAGVMHRHPGLRLIVSHGGAALPLLLGRLERNHQLHADDYPYSVREGFSRLYFDSVVCDPAALRMLLQVARPEQVLLGSDFPFPWEPHPVRTVVDANLGDAVTRLICEQTPGELFAVGKGTSGAAASPSEPLGAC
jgi:aminocarboxymuconate-semialdehyde decarboxylase